MSRIDFVSAGTARARLQPVVLAALAAALVAALVAACHGPPQQGAPHLDAALPQDAAGDRDALAAADAGAADAAASDAGLDGPDVPLAGEVEPGVWRELVTLDAPAAPANPQTGDATPTALNRARLLRYRAAETPGPVRAVVVCMPGMPAGAMAFDQLARRLIHLARPSPAGPGSAVEVWAIDRRANLLEDLTGMQAAERARDPDLGWRYYDEGLEIHGRRFDGGPGDASYMSEWGLAVAVADLRAVLQALIPSAAHRRAHVVLVGHSFGAALVQAYAAWDLEGTPASAELAGLVLLDGGLHLYPPIDEAAYLDPKQGLGALRSGVAATYLDYYGFGVEVFLTLELTAMAAHLTPDAVVRNRHTDWLGTLLFLRSPPPMTAAAMIGFAIDDASSPTPGGRARCGATDGPLEPFVSPLTGEVRQRPADLQRTYGWLDYDQVQPREKTSVAVLARLSHEGPTNRVSWYMPRRLPLDAAALSALDVGASGDGDWRLEHGLRATRNAQMDAPVLAVIAGHGLVRSPAPLHAYRASIAPAVGAGRPRAGAARAPSAPLDQAGFAVLDLPDHAHDDVVHASGPEADVEVYGPLLQWMLSNVAPGTITVAPTPPDSH